VEENVRLERIVRRWQLVGEDLHTLEEGTGDGLVALAVDGLERRRARDQVQALRRAANEDDLGWVAGVDEARERLKAMSETSDGFVIAERDLKLRGPGDFFGTRQSGIPQLRAGDLTRDVDLLELAYTEARTRVDHGTLTEAERHYVQNVWQRQFGLITVG
jgi:hypothetical protein